MEAHPSPSTRSPGYARENPYISVEAWKKPKTTARYRVYLSICFFPVAPPFANSVNAGITSIDNNWIIMEAVM